MSEPHLTDAHNPARVYPLPCADGGDCTIGREAPATLVFALPSLSRRHAAVSWREGCHWLSDLGSRNGTFVNGVAVQTAPVRLIDGDEIVMGGVLALRFHDPTQTAAGERIGRLRGVWLNERSGHAYIDGIRIEPPLSAAQTALLTALFNAQGQVVSRDAIVAAVWPSDEPQGISEEAIDGLIKRVRARLRETAPGAEYIEMLRGRGVRLNPG